MTIDYWTYAADTFCTTCAETAYGPALDDGTARDGEGNPPRAVYDWDEGALDEDGDRFRRAAVHCGACGAKCRDAGEWE